MSENIGNNQNIQNNNSTDNQKSKQKRKIKSLILFVTFVFVITAAMSGVLGEIGELGKLFQSDTDEDVLIVQKVSAYSANSLGSSIKNVGTVNILELTLGNDIDYSGAPLAASQLSVPGSSTFYLDVNGHNLNVNNEESAGFIMEDSTFYAVDNVGGGNIDVSTKNCGITCKNFVFTGGSLTVEIIETEDDGPELPEGFVQENVEEDLVGDWYEGEEGNAFGDAHWEATNKDAIRAYKSAFMGNPWTGPCTIWLHGGGGADGYSNCSMELQRIYCGLRVGDKDLVNDGTITINNPGGNFLSTGAMGMFANNVYVQAGTSEVFGACALGTGLGNQVGLYFSDCYGFDGELVIDEAATLIASTRKTTVGIFSYGCKKMLVKGTVISGCRDIRYLDESGNIVMDKEAFNFKGTPHYPSGNSVQVSAITLDLGDLIISGPSAKCFLRAYDKTILIGQQAREYLTGPDIGVWHVMDLSYNWEDGNVYVHACDGYKQDGYTACTHSSIWIPPFVSKYRMEGFPGDTSIDGLWVQNEYGYGNKVETNGIQHVSGTNYVMTHSGTFKAENGAFVLALQNRRQDNGAIEPLRYEYKSALYVSGGHRDGDGSAIQILGSNNAQTKVILQSDHYSIMAAHASIKISGNALVQLKVNSDPVTPNDPVSAIRCISNDDYRRGDWVNNKGEQQLGYGGALLVEKGAVLKCNVGHTGADGMRPYAIGINVANRLKFSDGATIKVNVDSAYGDLYRSCGIMAWNTSTITSGANVQVLSGAAAFKQAGGGIHGSVSINGENTYCNFTTHGGQFNIYNELGYGNTCYGALSSGTDGGVYISGSARVECSAISDKAPVDVGIHALSGIYIGEFASVKCTNAKTGIQSYKIVSVNGYSNVEISGVNSGIVTQYLGWVGTPDAKITIHDYAKVSIGASQDAIYPYRKFEVYGAPQVALKCSKTGGGGTCVWVEHAEAGEEAVVIDLDKGGYFSAYAPNADYGIGISADCNKAKIRIGGAIVSGDDSGKNGLEGTVICEGGLGGIYSSGSMDINVAEGGTLKAYCSSNSLNPYNSKFAALTAEGSINITGSGNVNAWGKHYGILAGASASNKNSNLTYSDVGVLSIRGTVNLEATGTYGGATSAVNNVSIVNGTTTGATTSANNGNIKKYGSIQEIAKDLGGFYSTLGTTFGINPFASDDHRGGVIAATGSSSADGNNSFGVKARRNVTGGPEEVWFFKYYEEDDSWTIQNYMTGYYLTMEPNSDGVVGASSRLITTKNCDPVRSHFFIKKGTYDNNGDPSYPTTNQYVIYTAIKGGASFVGGQYGVESGLYCITSQFVDRFWGLWTDGDFGTQSNDERNLSMWYNYDAGIVDYIGSPNNTPGVANKANDLFKHQLFSIDPIVDLGNFCQTSIKSLENGKYLKFSGGWVTEWTDANNKTVFTLSKDKTGKYPLSYEIGQGNYRLDVGGANPGIFTEVNCWDDNDGVAQRFRVVYCIGGDTASYGLMSAFNPWKVHVIENTKMITSASTYDVTGRFVFEGCAQEAATLVRDGRADYDSILPTALYGNTVTYRIDLTKADVNKFFMTTAWTTMTNVNPRQWWLYECSESNTTAIGKLVYASEEGSINQNSPAADKFYIPLAPSSDKITTYYLVLQGYNGSKFVGISEVAFYGAPSGAENSIGIAASGRIDIGITGKGEVTAIGKGYGIRGAGNVAIKGKNTNDVSGLSKVTALGLDASGKGIHVGQYFTTEYCTVVAKGTVFGIGVAGALGDTYVASSISIGDCSTVDAVSVNKSDYAIKINPDAASKGIEVRISPSASVYTSGKAVTGNGSIDPVPYAAIKSGTTYQTEKDASGNKIRVYETKYNFATVPQVYSDPKNANKKYGEEYFKTNTYKNNGSFSTVATNYTKLSAVYVGVGHNDVAENCAIYAYLPNGNYICDVSAYNAASEHQYDVNFAVSGYNKVDGSGELMFTAKYDMGEYLNLDNKYITNAIVNNARCDVYPLKSYSLETYKVYKDAMGTPLTQDELQRLRAAVSNGDGDYNLTWSEVKYYLEYMAQPGQTVTVRVMKDSLAFSTIKVKKGVNVQIAADYDVKLLRAVFDTSLEVDIDGVYQPAPSGKYPLEGTASETMLNGYDKIKLFYTPSFDKVFTPSGSPAIEEFGNGLTLPLFHIEGTSELIIGAKINFDNAKITTGMKY